MKMTLLEMVQELLNDTNGDEINVIDDTPNSLQAAYIIRSTYFNMINNRDWPHTKRLISLTPSGDVSKPTHMTLPSSIKRMVSINYNAVKDGDTRKLYQNVRWLENDDFLRVTNNRNSDSTNVDVIIDPTGIELLISNNAAPQYVTSFDDTVLVFDSYDSGVDNTLQASKVQAVAYVVPDFSLVDNFTPDFPEEAFPGFLEECKSRFALKINQTQDIKSEQGSQAQSRWMSRNAWRAHGGIIYPNYGRRSRKGGSINSN